MPTKMRYFHTWNIILQKKGNEVLTHAMIWMNEP